MVTKRLFIWLMLLFSLIFLINSIKADLSNCTGDCKESYVGDGHCDLACNNSNCNFDDGDCNITIILEGEEECAPGCPLYFRGDGYCDSPCNVESCQFDRHDCDNSNEQETTNCTNDQFKCTNGTCINLDLVCDDNNDCDDSLDEANCSEESNESSNITVQTNNTLNQTQEKTNIFEKINIKSVATPNNIKIFLILIAAVIITIITYKKTRNKTNPAST